MSILLRNPDHLVADSLASMLEPPAPVDLNKWATDNVSFGSDSPFPGPWNGDLFPFFAEILKALGPEDPCRIVSLKKSAQIGGTIVAQAFMLGTSLQDPGFFLYVHPTESNASRWAKTKLRPMIMKMPSALSAFSYGRNEGTWDYIERRDMRGGIQVSGASSPASLSMISMKRQVQDDLAKWENDPVAGDPEVLASSRSQAFEEGKIFKNSTPLVWPGCRITRNYRAGSQERFHVPCPSCGVYHSLEWENFVVDRDNPAKSHFVCPDNGCVIEQRHRRDIVKQGRWIADRPELKASHRSFYVWSAYAPLMSWQRIAEEAIRSEGDPDSEKTFYNDVLGLAYEVQGEAPPYDLLKKRADETGHRRGIIPWGFPLLTLGVDVQGDRLEWHLQGFGPDLRKATVDYGTIDGFIGEEETQKRLDDLIKSTWPNAAGNKIAVDMMAIDGNAYTEDVFDWAKSHSRTKVMVIRGRRGETAPLIAQVKEERDRKGRKKKRRGRPFYNLCVSKFKLSLYRNLEKTDPLQRGYVALASGFDEEWFEQYTSEKRVAKKSKTLGAPPEYVWVKGDGVRNEVLDTAIYGEAAAITKGWRDMPPETWDRLISERETRPDTGQMDLEDLLLKPPAPAVPVIQNNEQPTKNEPDLSPAMRRARLYAS